MLKNVKKFIRVNGRVIPILKKHTLKNRTKVIPKRAVGKAKKYNPAVPYKKKSQVKISKYKTEEGHTYWLEKKGQRVGVANVSPSGVPNVKDLENIEIGRGFFGLGHGKEFYKKIFQQEKLAGTKFIRGDIKSHAALNIRSRHNTKFLLREKNGMEPTRIVDYSQAAAGVHRQRRQIVTHDVLATTKLNYSTAKTEPSIKAYRKLKKRTSSKPPREITSRKVSNPRFLKGGPPKRIWSKKGSKQNGYYTRTEPSGADGYMVYPPASVRDFEQSLDHIIKSLNKTKNKRYLRMQFNNPPNTKDKRQLSIVKLGKYNTKFTREGGVLDAVIDTRKGKK